MSLKVFWFRVKPVISQLIDHQDLASCILALARSTHQAVFFLVFLAITSCNLDMLSKKFSNIYNYHKAFDCRANNNRKRLWRLHLCHLVSSLNLLFSNCSTLETLIKDLIFKSRFHGRVIIQRPP